MIKWFIAFCLGLCFIILGDPRIAGAQAPVQYTDAQILRAVADIDKNQVQIAGLAQEKNIDRRIIDYARTVENEHNQSLNYLQTLSQELRLTMPTNGPNDALREKGLENIATLAPLDQDSFSRQFIGDIIRRDSAILTWIDSQNVQNTQIKDFLSNTWKQVATQLKEAQTIQEQKL